MIIQTNQCVVRWKKDETYAVAFKEFVRLKPKICSFLLDDNSEHKKTKGCK